MCEFKRPAKRGEFAYGCNECGEFAWWRPCFQPGEDKGDYVRGRGYVSYHDHPQKVCMSRLLHSCPGNWWREKDGRLIHERLPPSFKEIAEYIEAEVSPRIPKNQQYLFRLACEALRLAERYIREFRREEP